MAVVCVVGSVNMDLVARVTRLPGPGETVLGTSFATLPGGKGANQAVAARRAGAEVRFVGAVGDDPFGPVLRDGLAADGVDVRWARTVPGPSGVAQIFVSDDGENVIVVTPGANDGITADVEALDGCAVVLAQLEVPVPVVARFFAAARAAGVTTMLNAAPARSLPTDLLGLVDVLVVNEHELAAQGEAADVVPAVVVTLGAAGLRLHRRGHEPLHLPGHRVAVVDTVGAGDACCGALAASLALGRALDEAVVVANAAGALATTGVGARSSPTAAEITRFLTG